MNTIRIFMTALFVILAMGCGESKDRDIADTNEVADTIYITILQKWKNQIY